MRPQWLCARRSESAGRRRLEGRSRLISRLFVIVPALIVPSAWAQPIVYVDAQATGAGDGSSWCDAFSFLQDALAYANASGAAVSEIRVAQGLYKPDQGANQSPGDRTASFHLLSDVAIRGGYAGCGAEDPDEREFERFQTVLSGDLNGDDEEEVIQCTSHDECRAEYGRGLCDVVFGSGRCLVDLRDENAFHVVDGSGTAETALLEGFSIERGNALRSGSGGAVFILGGSARLKECRVRQNGAVWGGAVAVLSASRPTISQCRFELNHGFAGGALYVRGSAVDLIECIFRDNSVGTGYGGGAVFISDSSADIAKSLFVGNVGAGGAVQVEGSYQGGEPTQFQDCVFLGNTGWFGGAMVIVNGRRTRLSNCTFAMNSADWFGGALYSWGGGPVLANCILYGNWDSNGVGESSQVTDYRRTSWSWHLPTEINYSVVQGWTGKLAGVGNIGLDPMFVDPVGADGIPGTMDDDLRLMPGSPAIDAGANSALPPSFVTDFAGLPRRVNDPATSDTGVGEPPIVDMGAYEFQPQALPVAIDVQPLDDRNRLNLGSGAMLPVAVLTTNVAEGDAIDFDAANVDPEGLTLASAAPLAKGRHGRIGLFRDVDHDGDLDLVVEFAVEDLDLTPPDGNCPEQPHRRRCPPDAIEVVLRGETFDGVPIRGVDTITARGGHSQTGGRVRRP